MGKELFFVAYVLPELKLALKAVGSERGKVKTSSSFMFRAPSIHLGCTAA